MAGSKSKRWVASQVAQMISAAVLLGILVIRLDVVSRLPLLWSKVDCSFVVAGIAVGLLIVCLRALRWNLILDDLGEGFGARELALTYGASLFLGFVTPGKLGEVIRIWLARSKVRNGVPSAIYSVALDRIFDALPTIAVALLFLVTSGITQVVGSARYVWPALAVMLALLLFLICRPRYLQNSVERISQKIIRRLAKNDLPAVDCDVSSSVVKSSTLLKASALTLAAQMLVLVQMYCFSRSVMLIVSPVMLYAIASVVTVVGTLPLSIGGLGSREIALIMLLQLVGASAVHAIDFTLVSVLNTLTVIAVTFVAFVNRPLQLGADRTYLPEAG